VLCKRESSGRYSADHRASGTSICTFEEVTNYGSTLKCTVNIYLEFYNLKRSLLIDDPFPLCDCPFRFVRGSGLGGRGWRTFGSNKRRNHPRPGREQKLTWPLGAGVPVLLQNKTRGEKQDPKGKAGRCPGGGCVPVFLTSAPLPQPHQIVLCVQLAQKLLD